jgi:hypothetical protein
VTKQFEAATQQTELMRQQIAASFEMVTLAQRQAAEVAHQTRLAFMPVFVAEIVQEHHEPRPGLSDFGYRFSLTNVGRGTALDVRIEDVPVPHQKVPLAPEPEVRDYFLNARLVFSPSPFVKPDRDKPTTLEHRFLTSDEEYPFDLIIYLLGKHGGDREFDIWIRFSDVEGNKYKQVVRACVGGCRPGPVQLDLEELPALITGNAEETKTERQQCQSVSLSNPAISEVPAQEL